MPKSNPLSLKPLIERFYNITTVKLEFKALDEQTNCDHVYTHDVHAFLALMLIIFIGWDLFLLFNLEGIRKGYEYAKWTLDFLSELLKIDFCIEYRALS